MTLSVVSLGHWLPLEFGRKDSAYGIYAFSFVAHDCLTMAATISGLDFCEEIPSPSWRFWSSTCRATLHDLHSCGFDEDNCCAEMLTNGTDGINIGKEIQERGRTSDETPLCINIHTKRIPRGGVASDGQHHVHCSWLTLRYDAHQTRKRHSLCPCNLIADYCTAKCKRNEREDRLYKMILFYFLYNM